jgi:hypothetical protein
MRRLYFYCFLCRLCKEWRIIIKKKIIDILKLVRRLQYLDDVKKLKEDQLQYRSKHKALKDEPTDVRLGVVIENK